MIHDFEQALSACTGLSPSLCYFLSHRPQFLARIWAVLQSRVLEYENLKRAHSGVTQAGIPMVILKTISGYSLWYIMAAVMGVEPKQPEPEAPLFRQNCKSTPMHFLHDHQQQWIPSMRRIWIRTPALCRKQLVKVMACLFSHFWLLSRSPLLYFLFK